MYRFILSLIGIATLGGAFQASATEYDSEGYPVFYVKGTNCGGWETDDAYRMQRSGSRYSIRMQSLQGEFKISDDNWMMNFGASHDMTFSAGELPMKAVADGPNFCADAPLENVTIYLEYDAANTREALMWCCPEGVTPAMPQLISGTLPVLYINVYDAEGNPDNEIIDTNLAHKNYFSGEYWLDVNGCTWLQEAGAESVGSAEAPLPLQIKARGNWTRKGFAKKPFKLKLESKASLLGLSKSKHYAILAHADDTDGYLRNFTGFNLGHRIGLPWTPSQQPVEVVINGDYRGLYFLTESIRIEKDRINITELEDLATDPELVSGGYLVELDNYDEDNQIRMEELGAYPGYKDMLRVTFDTPEEYSEIQYTFINDQFTAMNNLAGTASDELWSYIDLDDAVRYYLVCELACHTEAYHGSTYMFRDRGADQKWHYSPLWDFGNAFSGPTDGFIYDNSLFGMTWLPSFPYNEKFNLKVRETWRWFMKNRFDGLYSDMADICGRLQKAAEADRNRWRNVPHPDGGQPVADNTDILTDLDNAMAKLRAKVEWLKGKFGDYADASAEEPARDATPAAPLPPYITAGIESVTLPAASAGTDCATIYDLQGNRVTHPAADGIYIVVTPDGAKKVLGKNIK